MARMITDEILKDIFPNSLKRDRDKYIPYLNKYWDTFDVNTLDRQRAFLAQIGHESAQLKYAEEIASGRAYEGRKDLGNTEPGDGVRFKGRGLIMVTGRKNYTSFNKWLHDFNFIHKDTSIVEDPTLIAKDPELAVLAAFWFWDRHDLNKLADLPK